MVFVVSGPSGSGKTTLLQGLLKDKKLSRKLAKSISLTTRPKRSNERQGRDYFFVSEKRFKQKLRAKKILEWTKYLGYYYATPKAFVDKKIAQGKHLILCLDFKGAQAVKKLYPKHAATIFVAPPSLGTLQKRIGQRCHKTRQEEIRQRLRLAKEEVRVASRYDYRIVNNKLEQAVKGLKKIILSETGMSRERGGL